MRPFVAFKTQEIGKLVLFRGCEGETVVFSWKLAKDRSGTWGLTRYSTKILQVLCHEYQRGVINSNFFKIRYTYL